MVLLVVGGVVGILNLPINSPRNTNVLHLVYGKLRHKYALQLQCIFAILETVMYMAEFCLDCWNAIMETNHTEKQFLLSKGLDFCEECGQWKHVIIRVKLSYRIKEKLKLLHKQ